MRISEMIEKLQAIQAERGNVHVAVFDSEWGDLLVAEIRFENCAVEDWNSRPDYVSIHGGREDMDEFGRRLAAEGKTG